MAGTDLWSAVSNSGIATTPEVLTEFARTLPDDIENNLSSILPDREVSSIKWATRTTTRRNTRAAMYRTWNAEVPIGTRAGQIEAKEGEFLPIGQELILTEWEQIQLFMAQGGSLPIDRVIEVAYNDIATNTQAIRNRVELARGAFLDTGKFTLTDENGLRGIEYDAQLLDTHRYQVSVSWSDPTATALTDEINARKIIIKDSVRKTAPSQARANSQLRTYLARNIEYRRAAYPGVVDAALPGTLQLAQVDQVRGLNFLPALVDYDHQITDPNGVDQYVIPTDRLILANPDVGDTQWGLTAQSLSLRLSPVSAAQSSTVDYFAKNGPGIVASAWMRNNPWTIYTQTDATPMPVAGDINGLASLRVIF
jgi:hypothetical protein